MKIVLQRVSSASVSIAGTVVGSIGSGILILLGIHADDTPAQAAFLAKKCAQLRIFTDPAGKMNLSVKEVQGKALVVSQFTLYGDCEKGRRPAFTAAAPPDKARPLYEYFVGQLRLQELEVATGIFGASMDVALHNDGPVTLLLEK